jgi:predicted SAM-dependent methyltransferase
VQCGDELWVYFPDGSVLVAQALDAGYLAEHWVQDHPNLPIVVDVPEMFAPFEGLSSPVRVINRSAAGRLLEIEAGQAGPEEESEDLEQ